MVVSALAMSSPPPRLRRFGAAAVAWLAEPKLGAKPSEGWWT